MKSKSNPGSYILRGSTSALLLSCVIVALCSATNLPEQQRKTLVAQGLNYPVLIGPSSVPTGNLLTPRSRHTATLLPNGKVLVVGGDNNAGFHSLSSAELYDPATGTWTATGSPGTPRFRHTATLLPNGKVLVAGGDNEMDGVLSSAQLYDPVSGTWTPTGSLATARAYHTATVLPNGKVLVAGGVVGGFKDASHAFSSAELYDPATGTWAGTGSLTTARYRHTATLLPTGKVLVTGGFNEADGFLSSTELYDPASGTWTATGSLATARKNHTATLLPKGEVLVGGGNNDDSRSLSSIELYDPASGTWTATGSLTTARLRHTATLLPNGEVLVAGGDNGITGLGSAELYDPATGTWTATGHLRTARSQHTATLLPSGKVLVAGGSNRPALNSAELYEPATGTWTATGSLVTARFLHTATLLPNAEVLLAGGFNESDGFLSSAELYDPASGIWTVTGSLATARDANSATLLPNGKVLVAGGNNGPAFRSAELYDPGLSFDPGWQPLLTMVTPSIVQGSELTASGSRFQGISEASDGNGSQNSSSNYPLVQLLNMANEQTFLLPVDTMTGWSDTSFTSTPITVMTASFGGFPIGYALVTVFSNGIPSQSQFVLVVPDDTDTWTAPAQVPAEKGWRIKHDASRLEGSDLAQRRHLPQ
jgi:N-acetylneuraminic acid mutarotase